MAKNRPFRCEHCTDTFGSKGALEMHRKSKHQLRVHSFGDLAEAVRKPVRPPLSFWRGVMALILSLASATFYAILTRYLIEHPAAAPLLKAAPWWAITVAANFGGLVTGMSVIWLRPKPVRTVAQKQQKAA